MLIPSVLAIACMEPLLGAHPPRRGEASAVIGLLGSVELQREVLLVGGDAR